jgi:hypothetical protein
MNLRQPKVWQGFKNVDVVDPKESVLNNIR